MSGTLNEGFGIGREDGFSAGLLGAGAPPKPDPVKAAADPEFAKQYQQGAALGFARGKERRELVQSCAERQIDGREM